MKIRRHKWNKVADEEADGYRYYTCMRKGCCARSRVPIKYADKAYASVMRKRVEGLESCPGAAKLKNTKKITKAEFDFPVNSVIWLSSNSKKEFMAIIKSVATAASNGVSVDEIITEAKKVLYPGASVFDLEPVTVVPHRITRDWGSKEKEPPYEFHIPSDCR